MKYNFFIVGTGGTGTYVASFLSRYLFSKTVSSSIFLVDGDIIENKNLTRQLFTPNDIGMNKAACFSGKLRSLYGGNHYYYDSYIDNKEQLLSMVSSGSSYKDVPVIIGCVDNHHARLVMTETFDALNNVIYIDSANEESKGEVVIAIKINGEVISPTRDKYFPEIFNSELTPRSSISSCDVKLVSGEQSISANIQAANGVMMFVDGIIKKSVKKGIYLFDNASFSSRLVEF